MSDNLCPVCGAANRSMGDKDYTYWACGRVVGPDGNEAVACSNAAFEVQHLRKACEIFREQLENAHRNIGAFRADLATHEESTRLLADYAEMMGIPWTSEDERKGLMGSIASTHADVIRHLVECGRMEMVKDDSSWGICAVWVEEA